MFLLGNSGQAISSFQSPSKHPSRPVSGWGHSQLLRSTRPDLVADGLPGTLLCIHSHPSIPSSPLGLGWEQSLKSLW